MLWYRSAPETDGFLEGLLEQSQKNFLSFLLISIEYLKENNLDLETFFTFLGQRSVNSWEETEDLTLEEIVSIFNFNLLSIGMRSIDQKTEENTVVINYTPLVTSEYLENYNITRLELDTFWKSLEIIAKNLDIECSIEHKEDTILLKLSKNV